MVDCIEAYWIKQNRQNVDALINADNGTENSCHGTKFMKRIIESEAKYDLEG